MKIVLLILCYFEGCLGFMPSFAGPVENITVARGKDAIFTCLVRHLGGYRVGWVKADTKAIQSVHTHVITHNPRIRVAFSDHSTWQLVIKDVREEDEGPYMCQINTDPMIYQIGFLEVWTQAEIVDEESSSDRIVMEGDSVTLRCTARGNPSPSITWRREDGKPFAVDRQASPEDTQALATAFYKGENLQVPHISRSHMGAYLCIARNKVPPPVSKRIFLEVHFHPVIHVPEQLIGSPFGSNVTLLCNVEASPAPVAFWNNNLKEMSSNSTKYIVRTEQREYSVHMSLTIRNLSPEDLGQYTCIARNSIGEVSSDIRVYDIPPLTTPFPLITKGHPSSPDLSASLDDDDPQVLIIVGGPQSPGPDWQNTPPPRRIRTDDRIKQVEEASSGQICVALLSRFLFVFLLLTKYSFS